MPLPPPSTPAVREFSDEAARFALTALTSTGPYLPWGAGVMRPAGLVAVCNDIVLSGRRRIVELGNGVNTVVFDHRAEHEGVALARTPTAGEGPVLPVGLHPDGPAGAIGGLRRQILRRQM